MQAARDDAAVAAERLAKLGREVEEAKGEAAAATAVAEERRRSVEVLQEKMESVQEVGKVDSKYAKRRGSNLSCLTLTDNKSLGFHVEYLAVHP